MTDFHERYPKFEDWAFRVNQNTGNREQVQGRNGLYGYESTMIDRALQQDDPEAFIGFLREFKCDPLTQKTFDGLSMTKYAEKRGAKKCAAAIAKLSPMPA